MPHSYLNLVVPRRMLGYSLLADGATAAAPVGLSEFVERAFCDAEADA